MTSNQITKLQALTLRRWLSLAVFVVLCLSLVSVSDVLAQGDDDHGNTPANATAMTLDGEATGHLETAGDVDYFSFTLTGDSDSTEDVWLFTTGSTDTLGVLFNGDGARLAANDDSPLTDAPTNFHIGESLGPGTYYIAVSAADTVTTGAYTLKSSTGTDQGAMRAESSSIRLSSTVEGIIGAGGDRDVFKLDLSGESGPRQVAIYSTTSYLDPIGALLDYSGVSLVISDDSPLAEGDLSGTDFFVGQILEPGIYYILVLSFGAGTGPYQLHVETVSDQQNSRSASAPSIEIDSSSLGFIESRSDEDYFKLTLSSATEVNVYTLGATDTVGELQDSSGTSLAENDDSAFSDGRRSFYLARSLAAGTYYVAVSGYGEDTGPYRLFVDSGSDPTNATATATPLALSTPVLGLIDPANGAAPDSDLYEVVVGPASPPATTREVIFYTIGDTDTEGTLLSANGTTLIASDDDSGDDLNFLIRRNLAAGTYYLRVEGSEEGEYAVSAEEPIALPVDGRFPLTRLSPGFDEDFFKLSLASNTDIWIYTDVVPADVLPPGLSLPLLDTVATLYDSDFNRIEFNDDALLLNLRRASHFRHTLAAGDYYVKVGSFGTETGYYSLNSQTVTDAGSSTSSAASLTIGTPAPGAVGSATDSDFFSFTMPSDDYAFIYVRGIGGTALAELLDGQGNPVSRLNNYPIDRGNLILDELSAGNYYIKVTAPRATEFDPIPYTVHATLDETQAAFVEDCTDLTSDQEPSVGDDLFACQWHLENRDEEFSEADINVEPVWNQGIRGEGVNVAVVDDGIDHYHQDLRDNVETGLNWDYTGRNDVYDPLEHHGTAVAGLIGARDNNVGVRGVAPRATIFGRNILTYATYANIVDSMARDLGVTAVSNNSWGTADSPSLAPIPALWERAVDAGVNEGDGGKGIFYAWAAGNGHLGGDYGNLEELSNYYAVSAICAVNDRGLRSNFSERGPHLWVCGPSNDSRRTIFRGIVTTDNGDQYQNTFGGTSAASPIVAGVATLLRDANEDLTWRDLKLIMAATATRTDPDHPGWEEGARRYGSLPNSGNYNYNHDYGFGLVNAAAAVDLARRWKSVSPLPPLQTASASSDFLTDVNIPDSNDTGVSRVLSLTTGINFVEFVEVKIDFHHGSVRDLEIELESPSGAVSLLAPAYDTDEPVPWSGTFRFGSARHLGENPNGAWQLRMADTLAGHVGSLKSWEITLYGHAPTPGPPTISAVEAASNLLTVSWTRPTVRGTGITAYDLRYIPTLDDETDDDNWTVVEDVWTSGSENLEYGLPGLLAAASYDIQVRAVNAAGDGAWSGTFDGTPQAVRGQCAEGSAVADADNNTGLVGDCDVLLALKESWTGGDALNWSVGRDISQWEGVMTGGSTLRVTGLEAPKRDLGGSLTASLGTLTGLTVLDLSDNGFSGTIPKELGSLSALEELLLDDNDLSGPIPAELGDLSSLIALNLSSNNLSGTIPTELGSLSALEELVLGDNALTGNIPTELGGLSSIANLDLSSNGLDGAIPVELATPASMEVLDLSRNSLTGEIPSELASHTALREVYLDSNGLTGTIRSGFSAATTLDFSENSFYGGVSSYVGRDGVLEYLDLSYNLFSGRIRSALAQRPSLAYLDLSHNRLDGAMPADLGSLNNLKELYLAQNSIIGCTPAALRELANSDVGEMTIPYCDALLSGLTVDGARLSPSLHPNIDTYIAVAGPPLVTVNAQAPAGSQVFLVNEAGTVIALTGQLAAGHTVLIGADPVEFELVVISGDLGATHSYAIYFRRAGTPGSPAPQIPVTVGAGSLVVTWTAPSSDGGFDIISYDVRYLESEATDRSDSQWTLLSDAWQSGALHATIMGLEGGTGYDVQVRAHNGSRYSRWSDSVQGTPQTGPCVTGDAVTSPEDNPGLVSDCQELLDVADNLVETGTLDWSTDRPMSEWEGVTLSGTPQRVTGLELSGQELDGRVPAMLGSLPELTALDLSDNALSGPIPSQLGTLSNLTVLDLSENGLSGAIPTELTGLSSLAMLNLEQNSLSGSIPSQISQLESLENLSLGGNRISGSIPSALGALTSLEALDLTDNRITGAMPSQFGSLTNLETLHLENNEIEGSIPPSLGDLTDLKELSVANNGLSGEIPASLGSLTSLLILNLGDNQLEGAVPDQLTNLRQLQTIDLSGNALTGSVPAWLSSVTTLSEIDLANNQLAGPIPGLSALTSLTLLDLGDNQLTGPVPAWLGGLTGLEALDLSDNKFTGEIPGGLGSLTQLTVLDLSGNRIAGSIPPALTGATDLVTLDLRDNLLTGAIPPGLDDLLSLKVLDLSENGLTGQVPTEYGSITSLVELYLAGNALSGSIPTELGSLSELEVLYLNDNGLTGGIPAQLGNLTALEELDLSDNSLTGSIPAQLGSLSDLKELGIGENDLTGPLPAELGDLSDLEALAIYGTRISGSIPAELGDLSSLEILDLKGNQLSGSIPAELGDLSKLEELYLYSNHLTGELPNELAGLTSLVEMHLDFNQLTGPVPTWIGSLPRLRVLFLTDNQFTGQIPPSLGDAFVLNELHLNSNQLSGSIPAGLAGLEDLREFFIAQNEYTGCIPGELVPLSNRTQNDLNLIDLAYCPGAPTLDDPTPGDGSLTVEWSAPQDETATIDSYDVRYVRSDITSKDNPARWDIEKDVGSAGDPSHTIRNLNNDVSYDVQVRAVGEQGNGSWSLSSPGTPSESTSDGSGSTTGTLPPDSQDNDQAESKDSGSPATGIEGGGAGPGTPEDSEGEGESTAGETSGTSEVDTGTQPEPKSATLAVSIDELTFAALAGHANPPGQAIDVWNQADGPITFSVTEEATWLSVSPAGGASSGPDGRMPVTVSVENAGLAPGEYRAIIEIDGEGITNGPVTVAVNFHIIKIEQPQTGDGSVGETGEPGDKPDPFATPIAKPSVDFGSGSAGGADAVGTDEPSTPAPAAAPEPTAMPSDQAAESAGPFVPTPLPSAAPLFGFRHLATPVPATAPTSPVVAQPAEVPAAAPATSVPLAATEPGKPSVQVNSESVEEAGVNWPLLVGAEILLVALVLVSGYFFYRHRRRRGAYRL